MKRSNMHWVKSIGSRVGFSAAVLLIAISVRPLAAGTITYQITPVSSAASMPPVYMFSYAISGFDLRDTSAVATEIDIKFDPSYYGALSDGKAGPGFSLLLLQPNNPPGASGDYSIETTLDHPPLTGPFSVDATWVGPGSPLDNPAALVQTYYINQYDNNPQDPNYGQLVSSTSGTAAAQVTSTVPEPSNSVLTISGLILCGAILAVRRRRVTTA